MFYMIDSLRYSYTGRSDVALAVSLSVVTVLTALALWIAFEMTARGYKLRT
jgi:hypothetical protein